MKYTIHGTIEGHSVEITWTNGFVTGDTVALSELFALASVLEGRRVGPEPTGPFTTEDHLSNPLSAQLLIEDVLDEITDVSGKLPGPLAFHDYSEAA